MDTEHFCHSNKGGNLEDHLPPSSIQPSVISSVKKTDKNEMKGESEMNI